MVSLGWLHSANGGRSGAASGGQRRVVEARMLLSLCLSVFLVAFRLECGRFRSSPWPFAGLPLLALRAAAAASDARWGQRWGLTACPSATSVVTCGSLVRSLSAGGRLREETDR